MRRKGRMAMGELLTGAIEHLGEAAWEYAQLVQTGAVMVVLLIVFAVDCTRTNR